MRELTAAGKTVSPPPVVPSFSLSPSCPAGMAVDGVDDGKLLEMSSDRVVDAVLYVHYP